MRNSVSTNFLAMMVSHEGRKNWMYLDILGFVTCGIGSKIDPLPLALKLPWFRFKDDAPASQNEIIYEWRKMKVNRYLMHAGANAARHIAELYLQDGTVDALVHSYLFISEKYVKEHYFPQFDSFPADAQMAILQMAYAGGPDLFKKFPKFVAAVRDQDWWTASDECLMRTTGNPGLVAVNKLDVMLFKYAAETCERDDDFEVLHWTAPKALTSPAPEESAES